MALSREIEKTLLRLIEEKDHSKIKDIARDTHPYDLWEFIENLEADTQHEVLSNLSRNVLGELLPELPDERQVE
ncbi:hypothetical protein KKA03_06170, partial [archaeon]|nr:hypothetical protein [archaeon]